jgi:lipid II:glycine glycyltransferase (peptidoglycan interpeptide bridge formation enzyme)
MKTSLQIIEIKNKREWEGFIFKYAPQSLFQSWSWSQIQNGNMVWNLGLYDKEILKGIAFVIKVVARRGTFLHIRHGPILAEWNEKYLTELFKYIKEIAKHQKAVFIRISPLIENSSDHNALLARLGFADAPIHQMDGEYCWVLDLDKPEEILLAAMRKTTRYLIRQAQKMGVVIQKSTNEKDIDAFLKLYSSTAKRQQFVPHKGIQEEFHEFLKEDNILLFNGYYQKAYLSGALILFYNHQAIYHHSASMQQKIPVNYVLQWEAIKEAIKRGKKVYNFWGIAPENNKRHPWAGLSLFKKGFGGRLIEYIHAKDLPLSPKYCATYGFETIRKIWKGYS